MQQAVMVVVDHLDHLVLQEDLVTVELLDQLDHEVTVANPAHLDLLETLVHEDLTADLVGRWMDVRILQTSYLLIINVEILQNCVIISNT